MGCSLAGDVYIKLLPSILEARAHEKLEEVLGAIGPLLDTPD